MSHSRKHVLKVKNAGLVILPLQVTTEMHINSNKTSVPTKGILFIHSVNKLGRDATLTSMFSVWMACLMIRYWRDAEFPLNYEICQYDLHTI